MLYVFLIYIVSVKRSETVKYLAFVYILDNKQLFWLRFDFIKYLTFLNSRILSGTELRSG